MERRFCVRQISILERRLSKIRRAIARKQPLPDPSVRLLLRTCITDTFQAPAEPVRAL